MTSRVHSTAVIGAVLLATCLLLAGAAAAQEQFACTGEAFIVQREDAQLFLIDQTLTPFVFEPVGPNGDEVCDDLDPGNPPPPGEPCNLVDDMGFPIEANNMGFRSSDGFLYAVELTAGGNSGIISIDAGANVTFLGTPAGLPFATTRTDAGDISADGDFMYVNQAGIGRLWIVDLNLFEVIDNPVISGAAGAVNDWAYNPNDGNLYGGDQGDGQIARLDVGGIAGGNIPRIDFSPAGCAPVTADCDATSLPSGIAFGGAWFNGAGQLHVYQNGITGNPDDNDGKLFVIQLDLSDPGNPAGQIVRTQLGRDSEGRNDGAACIPDPPYGVAKSMTAVPTDSLPSTVTIDYVFENLGDTSPVDDLINLTAIDDLVAVFGDHGDDWTFTSIASAPAEFANPGFNGHSDTEMINQAPNQSLLAGDVKTITVVLEVLTLDNTNPPPFTFCNQVVALAENGLGIIIGDLSTDGDDPDPDGDGFPDERELSCIDIVPPDPAPCINLIKDGFLDVGVDGVANAGDVIDYTFDVTNCGNVALTDVTVTDPIVDPITCPSGNPIPLMNPGDSETCTGSYVVTQDDVDAGERENLATATGDPPNGPPVEDDDPHDEPIDDDPCINLDKVGALDLGADGTSNPGDIIDYMLTVTNCGNVTLTDVTVSDPLIDPISCPSGNPIPSMAPGDSEVCTGAYMITQADIDAGVRDNLACAAGDPPSGQQVEDCDPHDEDIPPPPDDEPGFPDIPTLGHLGLLILALGLAGIGARRIRRRG